MNIVGAQHRQMDCWLPEYTTRSGDGSKIKIKMGGLKGKEDDFCWLLINSLVRAKEKRWSYYILCFSISPTSSVYYVYKGGGKLQKEGEEVSEGQEMKSCFLFFCFFLFSFYFGRPVLVFLAPHSKKHLNEMENSVCKKSNKITRRGGRL